MILIAIEENDAAVVLKDIALLVEIGKDQLLFEQGELAKSPLKRAVHQPKILEITNEIRVWETLATTIKIEQNSFPPVGENQPCCRVGCRVRSIAATQEAVSVEQAAAVLGARGGEKGGLARAAALPPERRSEIAREAAQTRWKNAPATPLTGPVKFFPFEVRIIQAIVGGATNLDYIAVKANIGKSTVRTAKSGIRKKTGCEYGDVEGLKKFVAARPEWFGAKLEEKIPLPVVTLNAPYSNERFAPGSAEGLQILATLNPPFSATDLQSRLDGDAVKRSYEWLAFWKHKGLIKTVGFNSYARV